VVTSVGSRGDSYDNALAESVNGLDTTELVRRQGPWRGLEDLEFATLNWVDWYNHRRLFSALGYVPPAEYEGTTTLCQSWRRPGLNIRASIKPGAIQPRSLLTIERTSA